MRRRRPVAAGKLQLLDAELGGGAKKIIEGQLAKAVGNHANLHRHPLTGPLAPPLHSDVRNRAAHKRAAAPLPDPARPRRPASRNNPPPPGPRAHRPAGNAPGLVFFIFDLLHLDGGDVRALPLIERKAQLAALLSGVGAAPALQRLPPRSGFGFP
jgi:hypothetical protein